MTSRRAARSFFSTLLWLRRREAVALRWVIGLGGAAALLWAVFFGTWAREGPERCARGLQVVGARCCPQGQHLAAGRCRGTPESCPPGLSLASGPEAGCVAQLSPARVPGGSLELSPSDWQSQGVIEARTVVVESFALDRTEVTVHAFARCVVVGTCVQEVPGAPSEPGVPVTAVSAEQAARYCAFVGGRLPSFDELLFAAGGPEGRRFPWGAHGLVCRRAAFGLVDGPCGVGAVGPDLAGSRPDGATPEGVLDLVGNVAEWTRDPDGRLRLFGGSYRSKVASQLQSFSSEPPRAGDDVGFRCAYDVRR